MFSLFPIETHTYSSGFPGCDPKSMEIIHIPMVVQVFGGLGSLDKQISKCGCQIPPRLPRTSNTWKAIGICTMFFDFEGTWKTIGMRMVSVFALWQNLENHWNMYIAVVSEWKRRGRYGNT